jgi:hypothetical protein
VTNTFPSPFGTGIQQLPAFIPVFAVGVVTFVESVSRLLSTTETTGTVALSQTVDTARTLLVLQGVDARKTGGIFVVGHEPETFSVTAQIAGSGTTIQFDRFNATNESIPTAINCFASVMEFTAGTVSTQRASITIDTTGTSGTDTITAVDTAKTILISNGVKVHGFIGETGQEYRRWQYNVALTDSTTVTATRGISGVVELSIEAMALEFL